MSFATHFKGDRKQVVNFATPSDREMNFLAANTTERKALMKMMKIAMLVLTIAVALFILIPSLSWADDGGSLYKTKCAACHGADAAGKPAAKIPSLVSDDAKKASDADLQKTITENPKHAGVSKSLTPDQVKMLVSYIRSVQK
jgi:mono/diheme cytochrome c family protein